MNRLSYYYLWHFSAAELVVLTGLSGWEADAGLTGFTAFSSLLLIMGFATSLSTRRGTAGWVIILATAFSIRPFLKLIFGRELVYAVTGWPTGFGTWLFQVTWAPQHVASAGCTLIALYLLLEISKKQSLLLSVVLGAVVAAGFESSTWVGGVTFPFAALIVGPFVLFSLDTAARKRFMLYAGGAAVLSVVLASLFIFDQFRASALRAGGFPIGIMPYEITDDVFSERVRPFLDFPIYWTLFLFTEFAAFYPTGLILAFCLGKGPMVADV